MAKYTDPFRHGSKVFRGVAENTPQYEALITGKDIIETTWGDVVSRVTEEMNLSLEECLELLGINRDELRQPELGITDNFRDFEDYEDWRQKAIEDRLRVLYTPEYDRLVELYREISMKWQIEEGLGERVSSGTEALMSKLALFDLTEEVRDEARRFETRTLERRNLYVVDDLLNRTIDILEQRRHVYSEDGRVTTVGNFVKVCWAADVIGNQDLELPPSPLCSVWASAMGAVIGRQTNRMGNYPAKDVLLGDDDIDAFEWAFKRSFNYFLTNQASKQWDRVARIAFYACSDQIDRMLEGIEV